MNQIEKIEKLITCWEGLCDAWAAKNLPESKERIVYCSGKVAYYKGYLETLKLLNETEKLIENAEKEVDKYLQES